MKILLTGTQGLAESLNSLLSTTHEVTTVSQQNGHVLNEVTSWASHYFDHDILINNAYHKWDQIEVLEVFSNQWKLDASKIIINVGSTVSDYCRSEKDQDHTYLDYRVHKQALQLAFQKICKNVMCDVKLINPGPFDSAMTSHLTCKKLSKDTVAHYINWLITQPKIKRLDLWK